jgi:hypothetical protein
VTVLGLTIATGVALTGAPLSVWQAATTAGWHARDRSAGRTLRGNDRLRHRHHYPIDNAGDGQDLDQLRLLL